MDNLFVFTVIMATFAVPREFQQKLLLIGIVMALVMRAGFIAVRAAISTFQLRVFYIFRIFLVLTAAKLAREGQPRRSRRNATAGSSPWCGDS